MQPFCRFTIVVLLAILAVCTVVMGAEREPEGGRHRVINKKNPGKEIDIKKFIVPGKTNIFEFFSQY